MFFKRVLVALSVILLCQYVTIAQTDKILQQSIESFLDTLEQRYDVHFIHESGIFDGSTIRYSLDLLDDSIPGILELFQKETAFKAIQMPQSDDSTLVYAVKREDSKVRISGRIVDQNNIPLAYSTVMIPELGVGTVTNFKGYYELEIDAGNHDIEASYVSYEPTKVSIDIAPGAEKTIDFILNQVQFLNEIVVTGSRNAVAGELGAGSSIIEHGTIANLINLKGREVDAPIELTELLHVQQPSFHSIHQHSSDGADHIDPATLRGMGPDQTLILINGKRKHQSAFLNIGNTVGKGSVFTDLNTIPISIIERIEILQDGASSQYGSDAIAGVINVILKKNSYSEINLKSGISQESDGFIYDLGSNFGFNLNSDGAFINVSLNHSERSPTNRTLGYEGRIFLDPEEDLNQQNLDDFYDSIPLNIPGDSTNFVTRFGQSALVTTRLYGNADIPINESINLYSFGGFAFKQGGSVGVYRFPFQTSGSLQPTFGFSPQLDTEINDQTFTIGLKKVLTKGVLDISNTWGRNSIVYKIKDPNGDIGPDSPADIESGEVLYGQNTTNIDYSHLLNTSMPLAINAGAEFRIENYTQKAGDFNRTVEIDRTTANIGDENLQLFPRFDPTHELNEYRTNIGVYLDLEADLSKQMKVGLSGRFERYDDFGSNFSWKLFSRWNPSKDVSFKFSYTTGFRAPSLHQFFYTSRLNQFVPTDVGFRAAVVDQYNHSLISNNPPLATLGVDPLKAESSNSFNAGFIFRPSKRLSISTNFYQIDVDDRIILSGRVSNQLSEEIQTVLAQTNSTDVQFFTNAIGTRTMGLEFITKYVVPFSGSKGSLDFTFSGHMNRVNVMEDNGTRLTNLNTTLQGFEDEIFNRFEVGLFESAQPNSKLIFASSLHRGKFNFHTRFTRYGSITYLHPLDGDSNNFVLNELTNTIETRDQTFNSKILTDISMQLSFTDNFSLSLGVNNAFNVYPDENQHSANRGEEAFPYNRFIQQFGTRGRFGYANLNIRF
jgi:iron complex outermembrane receptor protein